MNQSRFKLLSLTHEYYNSFDCGYDVKGVFLDMSKAFDKFCHGGVMFNENGIWRFTGYFTEILLWPKTKSSIKRTSPFLDQCYSRSSLRFNSRYNVLYRLYKYFIERSLLKHYWNIFTSRTEVKDDLSVIKSCTFQWKMGFNLNPSKHAQVLIFRRKTKKVNYTK